MRQNGQPGRRDWHKVRRARIRLLPLARLVLAAACRKSTRALGRMAARMSDCMANNLRTQSDAAHCFILDVHANFMQIPQLLATRDDSAGPGFEDLIGQEISCQILMALCVSRNSTGQADSACAQAVCTESRV